MDERSRYLTTDTTKENNEEGIRYGFFMLARTNIDVNSRIENLPVKK